VTFQLPSISSSFGGSRSGKTFLLTRNVAMRALKAPNSRHAIFRYRFNALKASVIFDTFPAVMRAAFPQVPYKLDKTDWYATFPNGSQIWFGGLDDKERAEKILGMEFVTIYLNECSQIPLGSRRARYYPLGAARRADGAERGGRAAEAAGLLR
jgi:phage terminase large subunit